MPRNNKTVVIERRKTVAELKLRGVTQAAIAERLGVTEGLISQDLKAIRAKWREETNLDTKDFIDEKLAEYAAIKTTAWNAYLKSAEDYEQKMKKSKGRMRGVKDAQTVIPDEVESSTKTMRAIGNHRYLDIIMNVIKSERELLGADAPVKTQLSADLSNMTNDELKLLLGIKDKVNAGS
jgi:predicted transcriptional regulator